MLVGLLSIYFLFEYQKLKNIETKKLSILNQELEKEKNLSIQLQTLPEEINIIKRNTNLKIQKIKVSTLSIDFSLREIFS